MENKSQRIRITEKGWNGYTGNFGGIEFKDGISIEVVDPMQSTRLGSLVSIKLVDSNLQAGEAANQQRNANMPAEVVPELPRGVKSDTPTTVGIYTPKYTREGLEQIADKHGIAGLRAIAEPLGIRGRGIAELVEEIMKGQTA